MRKGIRGTYRPIQLVQKGKNLSDAFQERFDFFGESFVGASIKVEIKSDTPVRTLFGRIGYLRLGIGAVQGETDGRVARQLPPVLSPVLDDGEVGRAAPYTTPRLNLGRFEYQFWVFIIH